MTLYSKVLTKFVKTPGLKIRISLELPPDADVSEATLNEARTALRELGLDENLG